MRRITKVEVRNDYLIELRFDDGTEGTVDLSHLAGNGVFTSWHDYPKFQDVRIGETGDLRWQDGVDLCPDALYLKVTGKSPEEAFPELTSTSPHA